jgi:PH/SEC7 domain-containing protein
MLDEELALLGAPWAKEGMLARKLYLDADGKRVKDKTWRNLFTVVGDGNVQMVATCLCIPPPLGFLSP